MNITENAPSAETKVIRRADPQLDFTLKLTNEFSRWPAILSDEFSEQLESRLSEIAALFEKGLIKGALDIAHQIVIDICKDIQKTCQTRETRVFNDHKALISDYIPTDITSQRSYLTPDAALLLGLFPEEARDPIQHYLSAFRNLKFLPIYELPGGTNRLFLDSGIVPQENSPLEWFLACAKPDLSLSSGNPMVDFLGDIQSFWHLRENKEERKLRSQGNLLRLRKSFSAFTEFGNDVPVIIQKTKRDNCSLNIDSSSQINLIGNPAMFGFEFAVTYDDDMGRYILHAFDSRELGIQKLPLLNYQDEHGMPLSCLFRSEPVATLIDRKEVKEALTYLRDSGNFNLHTVKEGILPQLPFSDRFDRNTRDTFFGEKTLNPLSVREHFEAKISEINFGFTKPPGSSSINTILALRLQLTPLANQNLDKPFVVEVVFKEPLGGAASKRLMDHIRRQDTVKVVEWDNGRTIVIFKEPLVNMPLKSIKESSPIKMNRQEPQATVFGIQSFSSKRCSFMLTEIPTVAVAAGRFKRAPIEIGYYTDHFAPGVVVNRHPMTWGYDPELNKLGFPTDDRGRNGLVNFWDISLPLIKPTVEQFKLPFLAPIRGLSNIPRNGWYQLLSAIEGDWLEDVVLVDLSRDNPDAKNKTDDEVGSSAPSKNRVGKFYKEPRDAISIVGKWIISHSHKDDRKYFVVDSPLYGNALFLFGSLNSAERAAKYFASEAGHRDQVMLYPDYMGRIVHSTHWRTHLDLLLSNTIFR